MFRHFDRDTIMLLEENSFNDDKLFYESVKQKLKEKAIVPMRDICADLSEQLLSIDKEMNTNPQKMVSRIRRDTRRAKTKNMYRANIWCLFMRDKYHYTYQPCMWFEYSSTGYDIGVGMFNTDAKYLDAYRSVLLENQREFRKALKSALAEGAVPCMEHYKKKKDGEPKNDLAVYYNVKSLYFIKHSSDLEPMFNGEIINELKSAIKSYAPMYKFLLKISDKLISEKGRDEQ